MFTDEETLDLLKEYKNKMDSELTASIGIAEDNFQQENCRKDECSLGNLFTDAIAEQFKHSYLPPGKSECKLAAVTNGGNIRNGIPKGIVTFHSILSALPFGNNMGILTLSGQQLIDLFEQSARQYERGGFLQVSGIRVKYRDLKKEYDLPGPKVKYIKLHCNGNWTNVDRKKDYNIVINEYLVKGGDFYNITSKYWINYGAIDNELLKDYITRMKTVSPKIDDRIQFNDATIQINHIIITLIGSIFSIFISHLNSL